MALTAKKRETLKIARELIADGRKSYICHALNSISCSRPDLAEACRSLEEYVGIQIGSPFGALGFWQKENGFGDRGFRQRRLDRLAWIDWMLGD